MECANAGERWSNFPGGCGTVRSPRIQVGGAGLAAPQAKPEFHCVAKIRSRTSWQPKRTRLHRVEADAADAKACGFRRWIYQECPGTRPAALHCSRSEIG